MGEPPLVSVLVTAHDAEACLGATLDSVLLQAYPSELLELIVVDDGSSDETASIAAGYAKLFPQGLRLIEQPHAGPLAALARAIGEARGTVLAPIEAGDVWPASRIPALAEALAEHPEIGLVYSDLLPIEGDPPEGRPAGRLLREPPCIGRSSIAFQAALLDELGPLPEELPRADWWLAVRAACVSEIAWVPTGPPPGGASSFSPPVSASSSAAVIDDEGAEADDAAVPEDPSATMREALAVQRWFLATATSESLYADELGPIWRSFLANARRLHSAAGGDPFVSLVTVTDADRAGARRAFADARDAITRGDTWPAAALAVRAAALDPWFGAARELVAETLAARPRRASTDPLAGARRFVTLAFADELLEQPDLLAAYGACFNGSADATLAIDACSLTPAAAGQALGRLVAELGLDGDGTAHLIAVLAPIDANVRAQLPDQVDALLSHAPRGTGATPAFDAGSIGALRALAQHASAA